jgi:hypothetical protein
MEIRPQILGPPAFFFIWLRLVSAEYALDLATDEPIAQPYLRIETERSAQAGLTPAATNTSAGATNPVAVSKALSVSATSAHAAACRASGRSLTTAR